MGGSIALVQLTELKHQRMKQCAEFRQRSRWQPPYALTTALELQAIEIPRLPKGRAMLNGITVVVPSANERRNLVGINEVTWSFPVDVVMVEQCLCVSPACTWAMFAGWLNLEELIVLAECVACDSGGDGFVDGNAHPTRSPQIRDRRALRQLQDWSEASEPGRIS